MKELDQKLERLKNILKDCGKVLVAFSGGVDSTLLLQVARDILGEQTLAVTATSEIFPPGEADQAKALAGTIGTRHMVLKTSGLQSAALRGNPPDRCYHCKKEIYSALLRVAGEQGINQVIDGVNADDAAGYRPGLQAGQELGVRSPLREAGLTKPDIYALSRRFALPTAHKPPNPCLATRFPYGAEISPESLAMVCQAEEYLKNLGISRLRVRHHGSLARIEVPPESFTLLLERAGEVAARFKEIGYAYTALDLQGFRSGSMDETNPQSLVDV